MAHLPHAEQFARIMVGVGQELQQDLPAERLVVEVCESCGEPFIRPKGRRRLHCPECKVRRSIAAQQGASDKSGPMWEKLVLGQYRRWSAEMRRLGLPTDPTP